MAVIDDAITNGNDWLEGCRWCGALCRVRHCSKKG